MSHRDEVMDFDVWGLAKDAKVLHDISTSDTSKVVEGIRSKSSKSSRNIKAMKSAQNVRSILSDRKNLVGVKGVEESLNKRRNLFYDREHLVTTVKK